MHFSTTYAQLLATLPPDLQEYTVQYRQLTKVINQIVEELSSHGLNPALLHRILERQDGHLVAASSRDSPDTSTTGSSSSSSNPAFVIGKQELPCVVYELCENSEEIKPQLRIPMDYVRSSNVAPGSVMKGLEVAELDGRGGQRERGADSDPQSGNTTSSSGSAEVDQKSSFGGHPVWKFQKISLEHQEPSSGEGTQSEPHEVIIPLFWDNQFFELLCTTLDRMTAHLKSVESNFIEELQALAGDIGENARPSSSCHSALKRSFRPLSPLKHHANAVRSWLSRPSGSDLYPWREIFRLYMEAEVFESNHSKDGGERSVEESERRLKLFIDQVAQRQKVNFKLRQSYRTWGTFLKLTVSILNIKRLLLANSEATRKILKKRTKRTALPFPPNLPSSLDHSPPQLALISQLHSCHLPCVLVQAIGELLIPIIPHVDDYSCLICTSIAFKPIRLDCKHVFCVRCLVKMQKRGKDNCPMCRASSVLAADQSNVDWALMNFMQDWFPDEIREKLKVDEKEVNAEQLAELGYDPNAPCIFM